MKYAIYVSLGFLVAFECAHAQPTPVAGGEQKESLLGKLHLEPKYFQPTQENREGGLGFTYKVDETVATPTGKVELPNNAYRMSKLEFKAEGTVAFKSSINPADFLKTSFEYNYEYSKAGVVTIGAPGSGCDPKDPKTAEACRKEALRSRTGEGFRVNVGATASFESDQKFDKRNKTYGAQSTIVYRPAPDSFANQWNPLDWPFRVLRRASNHPLGFDPSPDAFPKLRLALERVNPDKDTDREAILGKKDDYNRVNMEVAMSSPVATLEGKQVKFEWSWRYFKELSPNSAIHAASLDRFRYSGLSFRLDSGWRLTYATGRLPLNRQDQAAWELGYQLKFD